MKKIYLAYILLITLLINACKNPAKDIDLIVDANVIAYKARIMVQVANNATLPPLDVSVAGEDAAQIYDFSGLRKISAPGGIITVGVNPKGNPTANDPIKFNLIVKAEGYLDKNISVTIPYGKTEQEIPVIMVNATQSTSLSAFKSTDVTLSANGATTVPSTIATPATASVAQTASVVVPAGTTFRDVNNNVLNGDKLGVQLMNYDAAAEQMSSIFPGGNLSADHVVANGVSGSAFFYPAGFTTIRMFVDGKEVKKFDTPIDVTIQVNPNFRPLATGSPIKAGDQLPIYSYESATGQFTFHANGIVTNEAGKLAVKFKTDHLTEFIVGDAPSTSNCQDVNLVFSAPWLENSTHAVKLTLIKPGDNQVLSSTTEVISNNLSILKTDLPPTPGVKYEVRAFDGALLGEGTIGNPCAGGVINIAVRQPATPVQSVTLKLNVRCPGVGLIIVPNFDLFFKPAGAPASQYQLLGTVKDGFLRTTMLTVGRNYDFKANWGNVVKIVGNRPITDLDMSTTVEDGGFLGTKDPNGNRALLIEACKNNQ